MYARATSSVVRWLALAFVAIATPTAAQTVSRAPPISGQITSTRSGETAVLVPSAQSSVATVGQDLKEGDVLRTNARGTLAIVFADRTQVRLGRNSVLRVNAVQGGSPSSVNLQRGRVWGRTPRGGGSNLSVETPAATAGIRGTEWSITADGDTTTLQVFSGEVELSNEQGSLTVGARQAASAVVGRAPTRVALVNPDGREQMMYFLALEDGLELFAGEDVPGLAVARRGGWEEAALAFAEVPVGARDGAIASFGSFIAAIKLGEDRELPVLDENDPVSYIARAWVLSFIGELDDAIATADAGIARYPDEQGLYQIVARAALLLGDAERAEGAVDTALARDPADPAALALSAEIALDYRSQPYEALALAQGAVSEAPDRPQSQDRLSVIWLERGADREALVAIDQAIALNPGNAGYHARRATVLLSQNRTAEARLSIDRALELDPSLSIVRVALAEYYMRVGDAESALADALAASADNPAYGRALLQLAEIEFRLGQYGAAQQQLDAADRLDPMGPLTPLARAAIALYDYRADDAILAAREAVRRFQSRGGVYSSLSENRESGSLVSQSFRFLELENWGRYYGDRVFDSFTASSYFDQVLNRTPNPFVTRLDGATFNNEAFVDLAGVSNFLQGMTLEPLEAAYSESRLQFANEAFSELSFSAGFMLRDDFFVPSLSARIDGISNEPVPVAFSVNILRRAPEFRTQADFEGRQDYQLTGWFGAELTPYDRIVGFVRGLSTTSRFSDFFSPDRTGTRERIERGVGIGFYTHSFGYRNNFNIGGGFGRERLKVDDRLISPTPPTYSTFPLREVSDFDFASASYMRGIGRIDVQAGGEAVWSRASSRAFAIDHFPNLPPLEIVDESLTNQDQQHLFLDIRYAPEGPLILQGQVSWISSSPAIAGESPLPFASLATGRDDRVDYRIGAAFEPRSGQWLRAAIASQTTSPIPFTFAPSQSVGLQPAIAPSGFGIPFDSVMLRWDSEWTPHIFTAIDYQHQSFDTLPIRTSDGHVPIGVDDARIDRVSAAINIWLTGNIGVSATYAYTDSDALIFDGTTYLRTQVPYLPRHFGQVSASWTHPSRVKVTLVQNFIGGQQVFPAIPVEDFASTDASLTWEPLDRRLRFDIGINNLFDRQVQGMPNLPSRGREVRTRATVRF